MYNAGDKEKRESGFLVGVAFSAVLPVIHVALSASKVVPNPLPQPGDIWIAGRILGIGGRGR
jgi:hypothetical protein